MYWCVQGFFYLAGVSCAGLGNVAVVNGIAARHASQLVLSKKKKKPQKKTDNRERQTKQRAEESIGAFINSDKLSSLSVGMH